MSVTREQAEQVLAMVKQRYAADLASDGDYTPTPPTLIENWEPYWGGTIGWAILWEEGPDDWAHLVCSGGIDEGMAGMLADVVGEAKVREAVKAGQFTEKPLEAPEGVWLEPATSWAIGIYEG